MDGFDRGGILWLVALHGEVKWLVTCLLLPDVTFDSELGREVPAF